MCVVELMVVGATMLRRGVRTLNGTVTVTRTKLPPRQSVLLTLAVLSVMSVQSILRVADDPVKPGTSFAWVATAASAWLLLPMTQLLGLHG